MSPHFTVPPKSPFKAYWKQLQMLEINKPTFPKLFYRRTFRNMNSFKLTIDAALKEISYTALKPGMISELK